MDVKQLLSVSGSLVLPNGAQVNIARGGIGGEQMASELFPRYFELARNRNVFVGGNQARVTTTVGLATTHTGLCLSNPPGSGVTIVPLFFSLMQDVIQATQIEAFALAVGYSAGTEVTHTTPLTPRSTRVGSSGSAVGKLDSAATLPAAPTYAMFLQNTGTATQNGPGGLFDLGGAIILDPGAYLVTATPTQASVAGMWFSIVWAEIPSSAI